MGTKKILYIIGGIAITYLFMSTGKAFAKIVNGQKIRGLDGWGSGAFGASRSGGSRKHSGVDVIAAPGQPVLAPFSGTIKRVAMPYADDFSYKGFVIENDTYEAKIFYALLTVPVGSTVVAGAPVATAQNIAAKYGSTMNNHVHFEVRSKSTGALIDPTNLFG
ncbi:M23 family peptidase [Flavobacterium arcticum]|uniref:M23 family peptidase n=2 Tax=Flavobacterium arcticum TaxID=1784713 RepID=A0A345H8M3_9FLAO|nr:M23 family peptidase [Flavobacterium arcticum]